MAPKQLLPANGARPVPMTYDGLAVRPLDQLVNPRLVRVMFAKDKRRAPNSPNGISRNPMAGHDIDNSTQGDMPASLGRH
jgi:hypothetical protein